MKRLLVSLAAAAVMVAAIVPAAMAAPDYQQVPPGPGWGWGCDGWGNGGWGDGYGTQGNYDYSQIPMWKTLADKLGMNANDLVKELQGGKSVADVAASKDVSEQSLIDALMAPQIDALNARVQNSYLTQTQADSIQQAEAARVKYMLEQKGFAGSYGWGGTAGGYGMGWGGMMGPGMMGRGYGPWGWTR